ncbi:MAG: SpaA isopeptide-forming pilin-related protein [Romboutsia sp.]
MPNVSGLALLSSNRTINSLNNLTPIPGLPITLFNINSNIGASILSDSNGKFEFTNVEPGTYLLMETYGVSNTSSSPFDFSNAKSMQIPTPIDPDISLITTNLPLGTNKIDSLTPNTIDLIVNSVDLLNQHFVDGPIIYTPINILKNITTGQNLITLADGGTFGFNFTGTLSNTSPINNPYPQIAPSFGYQQYSSDTPNDGDISIVNIETLNTFNTWWNLSDHTTGDEVGNFLIVNGGNPGKYVFTETVSVSPSTYYAFSTWVANQLEMPGKTEPQFTVQVTGNTGGNSQVIFQETSDVIPTNTIVPQWKQIGAIFSSGEFQTLTVDIISNGGHASGNDYAIDDISLQPVLIDPNIITSSKSVQNKTNPNSSHATVGDTLIYTISISNISSTYDLSTVNIVDTISNDITLIPNSVVGGTLVSTPTDNPIIISVGTISSGNSTSLSFEATVNSNASIPIITNKAVVGGKISIDPNLLPTPVSIITNQVNTYLDIASLDIKKDVNPLVASFNDTVKYNIDLYNNGTVSAENVLFSDIIPQGMEFVPGSVYVNNQNIPTKTPVNNTLSITIPNIISSNNASISFDAVVTSTILSSITNTATISYNYITSGNTSPTLTNSSSAVLELTTIPLLNVSLTKLSEHEYLTICDTNIYTVTIFNNSSSNLSNVIFYDTLPCELEYVEKSFCVNSKNYNIKCLENGVSLGTIPSNSQVTIKFKTKAICIGTNPILNNQACINYTIASNTVSTCSNISTVTIVNPKTNYAHLYCEKSVCPTTVESGDFVTYSIDLYNDGTGYAENVAFKDLLPDELSFKEDSLYINSKNIKPVTIINNLLSLTLPCICSDSYCKIEFKALTSESFSGKLINTATISYNFVDCCKYSDTLYSSDSTIINVVSVPSSILLSKSVLLSTMKLHSTNIYTITISNNTLNDLNNVIFYDNLEQGLIYKPYSLTIDNVDWNVCSLENGVSLGKIPSKTTVVINFRVRLIGTGGNTTINNQACITYNTNTIVSPNTICSNICPVTIDLPTCNY